MALKVGDLVELSTRGTQRESLKYFRNRIGLVIRENKIRPWSNWAVAWTGYEHACHHDRKDLKIIKS
jgi:hypothetical protein